MKFSILITVYNKENYLDKCFSSILKQDYKNYEVIMIDDASTDNSLKLMREYASKYDNFKLYINKTNKKLSYNRNKLIDYSTGDYLLYLDPDDYISDTLLIDVLDYCKKGIDLIKVNIEHINRPAKDDEDKYNFYPKKTILNNEEAISCFVEDIKKHYAISGSYIFKKSIIVDNNIRFSEDIHIHEDVSVTPIIISYSNSIAFINKVGYYYVENINGISNSYYNKEEWKKKGEEKKFAFQKAVIYALDHLLKSPLLTSAAKKKIVTDLINRGQFESIKDDYKKYYINY